MPAVFTQIPYYAIIIMAWQYCFCRAINLKEGSFMGIMLKRPALLITMSAIALIYCIFEFNFVLPLAFSFTAIGVGNVFEGIMSFIQMVTSIVTSPDMAFSGLLYLLGAVLFVSLAAGVVLGGYFKVLNGSLEGGSGRVREFAEGIKQYFLRMFLITFRTFIFFILFMLFTMVVFIPGLAVTRAASTDRVDLLLPAVLIDVVTVVVTFFGYLFLRMYLLYWYPAAMESGQKAFSRGKKIADAHFWPVVGRVLCYDLVYLLLQGSLTACKLYVMQMENPNSFFMPVLLIVDWVFKTLFFGSFVTYIFSSFKAYREIERR